MLIDLICSETPSGNTVFKIKDLGIFYQQRNFVEINEAKIATPQQRVSKEEDKKKPRRAEVEVFWILGRILIFGHCTGLYRLYSFQYQEIILDIRQQTGKFGLEA